MVASLDSAFSVSVSVGFSVGAVVGASVGFSVGSSVGISVGASVGVSAEPSSTEVTVNEFNLICAEQVNVIAPVGVANSTVTVLSLTLAVTPAFDNEVTSAVAYDALLASNTIFVISSHSIVTDELL